MSGVHYLTCKQHALLLCISSFDDLSTTKVSSTTKQFTSCHQNCMSILLLFRSPTCRAKKVNILIKPTAIFGET